MSAGTATTWSNPAAPRNGHRTRGWKLVATVVGVAGCASLLAYLILWLRPPDATHLIVFDAGYERNLIVPPNSFGKTGADRLPDLGRSGGRGHLRSDPLTKRLSRGDVRRLLVELSDFRGPSITIVIAAHGGRDGSGAFLIPDDSEPDRDHRVRVKAVLDALASLPAKTRKLLVIEAATDPAVPALGQFHNDFARGLEALEPDIAAIPNLVVFASGGPDQRSWPSPEWGTTAFLHFLTTGLRGDADRNRDDRLSADELIEFVGRRTREWVRDHRAAVQEPVAFPRDAEGRRRAAVHFLTLVDRRTRPADPLPTAFEPPVEWQRTWDEFARLDQSDPHPVAFAPNLWREYVGWLMRYDQWTIAGADAEAGQAFAGSGCRRERWLHRSPPE
jgi:hypothetical protein